MFWFHRIGPLGAAPIPFRVVADTRATREHNVPLQELPSLCTRLLNATGEDEPAGSLTVREADIAVFAAELDTARAETEAARKRRSVKSSQLRRSAAQSSRL